MVILMGFSRVYLGAHFLQDVLSGAMVALLLLLLAALWRRYFQTNFEKLIGRRLLILLSIPIGLTAVYGIAMVVLGPPDRQHPGQPTSRQAKANAREAMATTLGAMLGFGVGITFEGSRICFRH